MIIDTYIMTHQWTMAGVTECGNADEIIILNADNRPILLKQKSYC